MTIHREETQQGRQFQLDMRLRRFVNPLWSASFFRFLDAFVMRMAIARDAISSRPSAVGYSGTGVEEGGRQGFRTLLRVPVHVPVGVCHVPVHVPVHVPLCVCLVPVHVPVGQVVWVWVTDWP